MKTFRPTIDEYKYIFENAVMGIYKSTPDGKGHVIANDALAHIYGYESVRQLLEEIKDIGHQLYLKPERREELLAQLKHHGRCINFESQVRRKDGTIIWISESARAIYDDAGNMRFIIGTVKDITHQKELEFRLRQANEEWEKTFDALQDPLIIFDKQKRLKRWNRSAAEVFQLDNPEHKYSCREVFKCGNICLTDCPIDKSFESQSSLKQEFYFEPGQKYFHITTNPVLDQDQFLGIVLSARDITTEKKLQREMDRQRATLIEAHKLQSLGEMVASIAHEINNPNAFIRSNIAVLKEFWTSFVAQVDMANLRHLLDSTTGEVLEEMEEILEAIQEGSERISSIIRDVKELSLPYVQPTKKETRVVEALNKSLRLLKHKLNKNNINQHIFAEQDIRIPLPLIRMEQILINLINNSIHAMTGKQSGELIVRYGYTHPNHSSKYIQIIDTGKGISVSPLSRIFEPFYTTTREKGGMGLGLWIVYQIVASAGGHILTLSKKGSGTNFALYWTGQNIKKGSMKIILDEQISFNLSQVGDYFSDFHIPIDFLRVSVHHLIQDPSLLPPECGIIIYPEMLSEVDLDTLKRRNPLLDFMRFENDSIDIFVARLKKYIEKWQGAFL